MSDAATAIVEALKATREARSIRQSALANTIGINPGHLSRIESGKTTPTLATLNEIARALDLEIMLVPRGNVPAVRAIMARPKTSTEIALEGLNTLIQGFTDKSAPPAYRLDEEGDDE